MREINSNFSRTKPFALQLERFDRSSNFQELGWSKEGNLGLNEIGIDVSGIHSQLEVIMPAYKKSGTIFETVVRLQSVLYEAGIDFKIHIVVDGPDELTVSALKPLENSQIRVSVCPVNRGKGSALRLGVSQSVSKYLAFLDADLDIHPESIIVGLRCLENSGSNGLVCAYGSKFSNGSTVTYPILRRLASRIYRLLVRVLFRLDVEDSQTGLKVFEAKAIHEIIDQSAEQRFLFDLEIFSLLSKKGYFFVPIPVALDYQYSSTIGVSAICSMIVGTVRLAWRMKNQASWSRKRKVLN